MAPARRSRASNRRKPPSNTVLTSREESEGPPAHDLQPPTKQLAWSSTAEPLRISVGSLEIAERCSRYAVRAQRGLPRDGLTLTDAIASHCPKASRVIKNCELDSGVTCRIFKTSCSVTKPPIVEVLALSFASITSRLGFTRSWTTCCGWNRPRRSAAAASRQPTPCDTAMVAARGVNSFTFPVNYRRGL